MKKRRLFWLAARQWRRVGALFGAMILAAVFLMGVACNVLLQIREEKNLPGELIVSASALTEQQIAEISQLEGVLMATPVLEMPGVLLIGEEQREVTLRGVRPEYLMANLQTGDIFPENSAMPYLCLNESMAAMLAAGEADPLSLDSAQPEELKLPMMAEILGETSIPARICGIVQNRGQEEQPVAYLSYAAVKKLATGQALMPTAWMRMHDLGEEEQIAEALLQKGFFAYGANDALRLSWQRRRELCALLLLSAFLALCGACSIGRCHRRQEQAKREAQQEALALRLMGASKGELGMLFAMRLGAVAFGGWFAGAVAVWIACRLYQGEFLADLFASPVRPESLLISLIVAFACSFICLGGTKKRG